MSKSFQFGSIFLSLFLLANGFAEDDPLTPKEIELNAQVGKKAPRKSPSVKTAFAPFTGKVSGDKVRMRLQPDLDGYIVRELTLNELITIIDQEGEFYSVQAPESIKAYIFRSFVLDNIVEGNRVNIRLEPDLEAPVIGHLNSGDRIEGQISHLNKKWLEITPPSTTHFYVAKDYIENIGGPDIKGKIEQRKESVEQLLEAANLLCKTEMEKLFEEIDFDRIKQGYLTIIHEYTDFPKNAELAKNALTRVQEEYLQKRIAYLEVKAALVSSDSAESIRNGNLRITQPLQMWGSIEEGLYASWAKDNEEKSFDEFYDEQQLIATSVTGVLEAFKSPVKNKPGDYIIKDKNLPVAYLYSTKIDLEDYVGKYVTMIGSSRSNHSFAFPAYFVHEVE